MLESQELLLCPRCDCPTLPVSDLIRLCERCRNGETPNRTAQDRDLIRKLLGQLEQVRQDRDDWAYRYEHEQKVSNDLAVQLAVAHERLCNSLEFTVESHDQHETRAKGIPLAIPLP